MLTFVRFIRLLLLYMRNQILSLKTEASAGSFCFFQASSAFAGCWARCLWLLAEGQPVQPLLQLRTLMPLQLQENRMEHGCCGRWGRWRRC
jgi:hypothetical protein